MHRSALSFRIHKTIEKILPDKIKIFLTQNNGTIIESDICTKWPIEKFASGVTNSMVEAFFLVELKILLSLILEEQLLILVS